MDMPVGFLFNFIIQLRDSFDQGICKQHTKQLSIAQNAKYCIRAIPEISKWGWGREVLFKSNKHPSKTFFYFSP
jgi:hypothetical protein